MIDVSAILVFSFGMEFEIALLGNASMSFPAKDTLPAGTPAICNISINFIVSFKPASGLMRAEGKLTPASFIYHPSVQLTGGFAFYVWFSGHHEGDFVMTVGGYHPNYDKPAHYPSVPRLQLEWTLGPLQIIGQAYFALTPKEMMVGLKVTATWESGPIKAWFALKFDFFIAWNPLYYRADGIVTIGVSATVELVTTFTISVEVSVELSIWGNPFGGRAVVDLDIISFTIEFGADELEKPTAGWKEFKAFLPADQSAGKSKSLNGAEPVLTTISVTNGLQKKGETEHNLGLIDPQHFEILIQTHAPLTNAVFNETLDLSEESKSPNFYADPKALTKEAPSTKNGLVFAYKAPVKEEERWWNKPIGIPSMGLSNIHSVLHVDMKREGEQAENNFLLVPIIKSSPSALWGDPNDGSPLVANTLMGFKVLPKIWSPAQTKEIELTLLALSQEDKRYWPPQEAPVIAESAPGEVKNRQITATQYGKLHTDGKKMIDYLKNTLGFNSLIDPADSKNLAQAIYLNNPILRNLGEI